MCHCMSPCGWHNIHSYTGQRESLYRISYYLDYEYSELCGSV